MSAAGASISPVTDTAVLVSGAGAGIGRAACLLAARDGHAVHAMDLDGDAVHQLVEEINGAGGTATAHQADTADANQVAAVFDALAHGPRLAGVFTAAGVDVGGLAHELDPSAFRRVLEVNTVGTFLVVQHALATMMTTGGGSIVLCGSPAGQVGFAAGGATAYGASKGAIASMTATLAVDYARYRIRVNAVVPGPTETALMWAGVPEQDRDRMRQQIAAEVPLRRLARPEEIAETVAWLLSQRSSYTTGSLVGCDGGVLAKSSISV